MSVKTYKLKDLLGTEVSYDYVKCKKLVEEIEENPGHIIFDFKNVEFMGSMFVTILARAYKACDKKNCSFKMINEPSHIKRVLSLIGFYRIVSGEW